MPTRPFDNSNFATLPISPLSPTYKMSGYAVPLTRPGMLDGGRFDGDAEWPPEAVLNVRALGKGVAWAFGIEGVGALCIFLVWHFWPFLR